MSDTFFNPRTESYGMAVKNMKCNKLTIVAFALVGSVSVTCADAILMSAEYAYAENSSNSDTNPDALAAANFYSADASSTDLINAGASTLSSATYPAGLFDLDNISDGAASGTTGDATYYRVSDLPAAATFMLDTSINTDGYDITNITTIAGWVQNGSGLANQNYEVWVSTTDNTNFSLLHTVEYLPFTSSNLNGNAASTKVELSAGGNVLAFGVDAIRFVFLDDGESFGSANGVVYQEIDVFTSTPILEPDLESTDLGAIWLIGDSITQSNADGDSTGSPRKALYDLLTAKGYLFTYTGHFTANVDGLPTTGAAPSDNLYQYHSGISGSVIGDDYDGRIGMTQNLTNFWTSGRLAEVKPALILMMLGANDVGLQLDIVGAPGRLKTLVENIYKLPGVGSPTVFLAQITPNRMGGPTSSANVAAFNAAVPGVVADLIAQGRDVRLVDQFSPVNHDFATNMQPDHLHPNAAGNTVMAQQWVNAITETWPGTVADFHSFDLHTFTTNGLNCKVAVPKIVAEGRPWVWRARFWGHESGPDVALLNKGFHVAYVDVGGLFGSPTAVARFDAFYEYLTQIHGLDHRVVLEGMSRGGLIIYNWARQNADKVHCIYADAPVCDFKSWPGGFGTGDGSPGDWIACKNAYGFTSDAEALAYGGNPVNNMQPLADAGIPLLHVVGDTDTAVTVSENTAIVATNYLGFGGAIQVIHKPGVGHVHGLPDPTPIIDFILNAVAAGELRPPESN
jgi:pimeloyl-ACP methyl ester carboxylesterase